MKICVAGEGAFGNKHLEALANIKDVEVVTLAGGVAADGFEHGDDVAAPRARADRAAVDEHGRPVEAR